MDGSIVIGVELDDSGFAAALNDLRQSAASAVATVLGPLQAGIDAVSAAFSESAAAGMTWSTQILSGLSRVRSGTVSLAEEMGIAGAAAGAAFTAGILSADALGTGRTLAARAIAGFSAGEFFSAGYAGAEEIRRGAMSGQNLLQSAGSYLASAGRSAFLSENWYGAGYEIASGIAAGISGGSGMITRAAVSAANAALASAKQTLGISSPSKVFRDEVGAMIPAGIAAGIDAGGEITESAMQRQAEQLVRSARGDVIPNMTRIGSGTQTVELGAKVEIHLDAPLYLDGRELARATARYTQQQMKWEEL